MKLPALKQDKANHVLYGAVTWLVVAFFASIFLPTFEARLVGFLAATLVGCTKEVLDRRLNKKLSEDGERPAHTVDAWDAFATALGGAGMWLGCLATRGA